MTNHVYGDNCPRCGKDEVTYVRNDEGEFVGHCDSCNSWLNIVDNDK